MKKYRLIIVCLLILPVFLLFNLYRNRKPIIETFNMDSTTKEEIAVYNYEVTIADIGKKEQGFIFVKFGVTPQVGAHNPLGYDELAYRVDSSGNKELVGYEHLKTYEVSEKFQKYIIKPFE